jgi:Fe-S cluster assembly protein SufD
MPSTRNEEYRYTDISPLLSAQLTVPPADAAVDVQQVQQLMFPESAGSRVVIVNGVFRPELSDLAALPPAAYVGGSSSAPLAVLEQLVRRERLGQEQLKLGGCWCW